MGDSILEFRTALCDQDSNDVCIGEGDPGLFFHLSKAFDIVNHSVLLANMFICGMRIFALDLFASCQT